MHWLLDRILLETGSRIEGKSRTEGTKPAAAGSMAEAAPASQAEAMAPWAKVEALDSVWFRLPSGNKDGGDLTYPIPLEDMRYQLHVYRRTGSATGDGETGERRVDADS